MRRTQVYSVAAALLLIISASACRSAPIPETTVDSETVSSETVVSETVVSETVSSETAVSETVSSETVVSETVASGTTEKAFEDFDLDNFDNSTTIDNEWLALRPGTRFVYEGTTIEDNGEAVPHRVEITITDLTKIIGDVRSVVSWDLDYSNDELVEAELAFYAQDNDGNVWRMGEYPEEYEDGEIIAAPTWIHGLADAHAGIYMLGDPQLGTPSYAQGWGPAVDWTDRGQVDQMSQNICVPLDCYDDVLVIVETSASEPDAQQLKYYARGVGHMLVGWKGEGEKSKETLELVELVQLSPEDLEEARAQALELEKSAYENSKDVYAHTPPAE